MATLTVPTFSLPRQTSITEKKIAYDAAAVARLVLFSLLNPHPRIQRETRESLQTLQEVSEGRRMAPQSILNYFKLQKNGNGYIWQMK